MKNPFWKKMTPAEREFYRRFNSEWVGKHPPKGAPKLLPPQVMKDRRRERSHREKERKFRDLNRRVPLADAAVTGHGGILREVAQRELAQRIGEALSTPPRRQKTTPE